MNKSKFLKKSLAMLLAIMMVVAMIPVGASAWQNDGVVVSMSSNLLGTKIDGSGHTFTHELPYNMTADEKLVIEVDKSAKVATVEYDIYVTAEGNILPATLTKDGAIVTKAEISVLNADYAKGCKVSFRCYDADSKIVGSEYVVNVSQKAKSTDTTVKAAELGLSTGDGMGDALNVKGTVSGKTITFTLPWGAHTGAEDVLTVMGNTVYTTLVNPLYAANATTATAGPTTTITWDDTKHVYNDAALSVVSQHGNSTSYTVKVKEAECLTDLTIAGVKATPTLDTDGKTPKYGEYDLVLPEDFKFTTAAKANKTAISYHTSNEVKIKSVAWKGHTAVSSAAIDKGVVDLTDGEGAYTMTFTSDLGSSRETVKVYTIHVATSKSNDASIASFTATGVAGGNSYTENGVVSGDKLTVEMPNGTALASIDLTFKVATGATVKVNDSTTLTGVNLTTPATVQVTAPDGKTIKYYELTATKAEKKNEFPVISGVTMSIGDDDYTGVVSESAKTITFTVPYVTTHDQIAGNPSATPDPIPAASYVWAKSAHTQNPVMTPGSDVFTKENTVYVISDNNDKVTYKVVYTKEAAKTGKDLTSLSFTTAADADSKSDSNTYKSPADINIGSSKITITMPYSMTSATPAMTVEFAISEGAKLYINQVKPNNAKLNLTAKASGFDDAGAPKAAAAIIADALVKGDDDAITHIVVADETAVVELAKESSVNIADLSKSATYRNHVKVYEVEIKNAAAQTGNSLTSFTADEGKVTSKVSSTGIEITVPYSYLNGTHFFPVIEASKLAKVEYNAKGTGEFATASSTNKVEDTLKVGELRVTGTAAAPVLEICTNKDTPVWTPVSKIVVTSELGTDSNPLDVTVKVAAAKTDALLTSLTVNSTKAVINNAKKTATVNLPVSSDLREVTVDYKVSELATATNTLGTPQVKNDVKYYDVSSGTFMITVTAEDKATVNVYTVSVSAKTSFPDVPQDDSWSSKAVYGAVAAGLIVGKADGTFGPNDNITRQDFAVIIAQMMGIDFATATETVPFPDKGGYANANKAIAFCASKGYISGKADGKFHPTDPITRAEAASVIARVLNLTTKSTEKYEDDAKLSWAKDFVYQCRAANVMVGDGKTFDPDTNMTRAMAASVLLQANNIK